MKKILTVILAGTLMSVAGFGISRLATAMSPALEAEYHNPALFRPWSDPIMQLYWLVPFLTALILLKIWNNTKSLISGNYFIARGYSFAFNYWIVTLPGMLMSYSSFPLSLGMVISWTVAGLAQAIVAGVIFARLQP